MTTTTSKFKETVTESWQSNSWGDSLGKILQRLQPPPETLVLISALLIGGGSGLSIVLFRYLIDFFQGVSYEHIMGSLSIWGIWTLALIPMLGGVVVGFIRWCFPEILGQNLSNLVNEPRLQMISPLRPLVKMVAAAISLGTGASLGPEGPSVEIGSNVGVLLGQCLQVSKERYRLLLAAGAGAGLAAGFNAPIAGVFFALEVVLGTTFTNPVASLILLSAVVSALIVRIILGGHPSFTLPPYEVLNHWEWIYYFGLGLLASLVSVIYTQAIKIAQASFQGKIKYVAWLGKIPPAVKPIIGGSFVGLMALGFPQILGIGYGTLEVILRGEEFPLKLLCLLVIVKLVATAVSLGSGLVGGIFAPALFIGACVGEIYGTVLPLILPPGLSEIAPPPAYAMVGMAAVLAGSVRAPLTAILLLFELTQNYLIILPLMAAVGVSVWVIELIKSRQSFQWLKWQDMGMNLKQNNDEGEMLRHLPIATIMTETYESLHGTTSVLIAGENMIRNKTHTALVVDEKQQLLGIITLNDIKARIIQAVHESTETSLVEQKLKDICTTDIISAYQDETLNEAIKRMEIRGLYLLPIVARDNPRQVLGVIDRYRLSWASDLIQTKVALCPFLTDVNKSENLAMTK